MQTYVLLMKASTEGLRKISKVGDRYDAFRKTLKKSGGRLIGAWATLGEYDYLAVVEVPSEKDLLRVSLGIGARGGGRVDSHRAFPIAEFAKMAKKL